MKPILKCSILALAGLTFSATFATAAASFAEGDLCIGFYQTDLATDSVVQPNTYVVNLGQASLYRENTQNGVIVSAINTALASSGIGADLSAIFGANWAESGTVRWCVVGGVSSLSSTVSGDPARTNYFSRSRASFANGSTGPDSTISTVSSTNRGNMSTAITNFFRGNNDGINFVDTNTSFTSFSSVTLNAASVGLPIANNRSLEESIPPATLGLFFGQGIDPRQSFEAGNLVGGGGVEGALDLYRILFNTAGADLTAGATSGNAVAGAGQYIGSLTIDSSGILKIQGIGSSSGTFNTWATTNGATGQTLALDHDNDGVSNGVEYFIGGPTGNTTGFTPVPGIITNSGVNSVTWNKAASYTGVYNTNFVVETSTSLSTGSWATETVGVNVSIVGNSVTYTFPAGPVRNFARLKVTGP